MMKNQFLMSLGLSLALNVVSLSAVANDFNMTETMKKMGFEFREADQAESVEVMQVAVTNLSELVELAINADHPQEKSELYNEGFNKLTVAIDTVETYLAKGDLDQAKKELREVDDLRVEYHRKRNPSIWSKIFG
ncbi:cytochrome b562 [Vibrio sp. YMD68]|uniref:cytochrome b562 n=1 Tax=Vibrio sp. YMD68 TaxID=3042300 RepID=UPI00249C5B89|nr:cytochrome b562 [Vibrio sp. YMD68]WGV98935.1 cytochrome b562 [Vibrio sp. YMD68]